VSQEGQGSVYKQIDVGLSKDVTTGFGTVMFRADILNLLNAGQEKLLKEEQISIDWTRVKRIADIQATGWQSKAQPHFSKLTLELWEWPGGRILELSTKVGPDAGQSAYRELQQLMKGKGLSLNATQEAKTGIALEMLTRVPQR
jgi:hypothetical protein